MHNPDHRELVGFVGGYVAKLERTRSTARREAAKRYKDLIDAEVDRIVKPIEDELADAVRQAYAEGLPSITIRDEVFFGNYTTWGKWRDRAGIPKERSQ